MSTSNMFLWRNMKNINTFGLKKKKAPYQELCNSINMIRAVLFIYKRIKQIRNGIMCFISFNFTDFNLIFIFSLQRNSGKY